MSWINSMWAEPKYSKKPLTILDIHEDREDERMAQLRKRVERVEEEVKHEAERCAREKRREET